MIKNRILIIGFFLLILFYNVCTIQFSKNIKGTYLQYFKIEKMNGEVGRISLIDEVYYDTNCDMIRIGYNVIDSLYVDYIDKDKKKRWYSFLNFKQNHPNIKNLYKMYNIPKTEKEAKKAKYKLIKKSEKHKNKKEYMFDYYTFDYIYKDKKRITKITISKTIITDKKTKVSNLFYDTFLSKLKIIEDNGYSVEYVLLKKMSMSLINKIKLDELLRFKKIAEKGEENYLEARRKYTNFNLKFKKEIERRIWLILKYYPNYYLGNVDIGRYSMLVENDFKKAEYYFKKAASTNVKRLKAYGYLKGLYMLEENQEKLRSIAKKEESILSRMDRLKADVISFKVLLAFGKKKKALNLLTKLKEEYKEVKFERTLKLLKRYYDSNNYLKLFID